MLCELKVDQLSQSTAIVELLELFKERGIAQDMADHEQQPLFLCLFHHLPALRLQRGHGFFQQHMIASVQRRHGRGIVDPVGSGIDYGVCKFAYRESLLPGEIPALLRNMV